LTSSEGYQQLLIDSAPLRYRSFRTVRYRSANRAILHVGLPRDVIGLSLRCRHSGAWRKQVTQLVLTNRATRFRVSQGHQTWWPWPYI